MIDEKFYLSEKGSLEKAMFITDLSEDEIEVLVGRFGKNSQRAGKLRGEVLVMVDGGVIIRHHFNKKVLWRI
jgi:hypothetical protein